MSSSPCSGHTRLMEHALTADEYEQLTVDLIERLATNWDGATTRLDSQVTMHGHATNKRVDVLWEGFVDGRPFRMIFECKRHQRPVNQDVLHTFRSVLDDIDDGIPTLGVLVSLSGYQLGARRIADTYGIVVLELRQPTATDVSGRVTQIRLTAIARTPYVEDVAFDWSADPAFPGPNGDFTGSLDDFSLGIGNGAPVSLADLLLQGELASFDAPPTGDRDVRRDFVEPVSVLLRGKLVGHVRAISGRVGERQHESLMSVGPGHSGIEYLLKNTLNGVNVWFTPDRTYMSPGTDT